MEREIERKREREKARARQNERGREGERERERKGSFSIIGNGHMAPMLVSISGDGRMAMLFSNNGSVDHLQVGLRGIMRKERVRLGLLRISLDKGRMGGAT